jgi:hypothetical protein
MKGKQYRKGTTTSAVGRANMSMGLVGNTNGRGRAGILKNGNPSTPVKQKRESSRRYLAEKRDGTWQRQKAPCVGWTTEKTEALFEAIRTYAGKKHGRWSWIADNTPGL